MKLLLFISVLLYSCESKPPSRSDMMKSITDKEKSEPIAFSGKRKPAAKVTSGFINGGLTTISGNASVSHGPTEDTIDIEVTHWGFQRADNSKEAIWHNVYVGHTDINAPYPGKTTFDLFNTNGNLPNEKPYNKRIIWLHDGLSVSYFISVSSDGGWNYAGKTIANQ